MPSLNAQPAPGRRVFGGGQPVKVGACRRLRTRLRMSPSGRPQVIKDAVGASNGQRPASGTSSPRYQASCGRLTLGARFVLKRAAGRVALRRLSDQSETSVKCHQRSSLNSAAIVLPLSPAPRRS